MGKCRFLYDNLITDETMFTVSSLRNGVITSCLKQGSGSATMTAGSNFSGTVDLEYTVEIDSIAGGAEVGQATFKWSDGLGTWNATGVATAATATTLNNGVTVTFTSGSGADFVVGDKWYFKGINLFNSGKMIDRFRDHRYRSATAASMVTITIDLLAPLAVQAVGIWDHNLTATATLAIKANTTNTWTAPPLNEAITFHADTILHYLAASSTYRYWKLEITNLVNPDGFIEIGELFLGPYLELSKNYKEQFSTPIDFLQAVNTTPYGIETKRFYNQQKILTRSFGPVPLADLTSMTTMIDFLVDRDTGINWPFYFNDDSSSPNDTYMVTLKQFQPQHRTVTYYDFILNMIEVLVSV